MSFGSTPSCEYSAAGVTDFQGQSQFVLPEYQQYQGNFSPCTPMFMPCMPDNSPTQGFMSGQCQGFMPSPSQGFATPTFMPQQGCNFQPCQPCQPSFQQTFQPSPMCPAPQAQVPEKVLQWLSVKALESLHEVIAEEDEDEESEDEEYAAVAAVHGGNVAQVASETLAVHRADRTESLAKALVARAADSTAAGAVANLVHVLLQRLPQAHRREAVCGNVELLSAVMQEMHIELEGAESETPKASAHGCVLLAAELFKRKLVGLSEVKALFGELVFGPEHPLDHAASLACHLFLTAGPTLERSQLGRKLADCMCSRLRELKGMAYSDVTLFSLAHVTDLRLNKWVPKAEKKEPPKPKEVPKQDTAQDDKAHKVLLVGEQFAKQRVASSVIKELFRQLIFGSEPADKSVELARQLLHVVRPSLACTAQGQTLAEYVELRLRELSSVGIRPTAFTFQACAAC